MTLRRYKPLSRGTGTHFDSSVVREAIALHGGCLGPQVGMPGDCEGVIEPDHVRASHAMGMKSRSTLDNCAPLCSLHHRIKTLYGREWRPRLIALIVERLARRETIG